MKYRLIEWAVHVNHMGKKKIHTEFGGTKAETRDTWKAYS
jgi:hypothetical protein